jgi:hypothetical protein
MWTVTMLIKCAWGCPADILISTAVNHFFTQETACDFHESRRQPSTCNAEFPMDAP